jgi:hypothetical protein
VLVASAVILVACDAAGEEPTGLNTSPPATTETTSPAETPTNDSGDDVATLEALNEQYWDVFTNLQNNPRIDAEAYDGIAGGLVVERDLGYIRAQLVDNELHREGAPEISNVAVTVDGDAARIEMCVDETEWPVFKDDEELDFNLGISATAVTAERTSEQWLISEILLSEEDEDMEITC